MTISGRAPPAIVLVGSTRPELVVDNDGATWVFKSTKRIGPGGVFAEIVVGFLGAELGVAIPEMAIPEKGDRGWLSKYHPGAHWDPMLQAAIENLASLGGSLALDALVGNPDRHAKNIVLAPTGQYRGDEPELHAWCIDHERCWLSNEGILVSLSDRDELEKSLPCISQPRDLPLDLLMPAALDAARYAERLAPARLTLLTREAASAARIGDGHRDAVIEVLRARCRAATKIVKQYLQTLQGHSS